MYTSEELLIPGAVGDLEALIMRPKADTLPTRYAIICHPHPLYGGTMNNKVVYMISNTFNQLGIATLRFNFRGVGKSAGEFDYGNGETEDLRTIVNWLQKESAPNELWLAGFSFGSYVALRGHRDVKAQRLLLVAPPVRYFNEGQLQLSEIPTLVIQGDQDEIVSPQAVSEWVATQIHQPQFIMMPEASHFFHGKLHELRDAILIAWG